MNKEELAQVLSLQSKAYQLLLWINEQARHQPALLSAESLEAFRYAESCETWVRHMAGIFPADLRPRDDEMRPFAHLFSSFFNTSFRVEQTNEAWWRDRSHEQYDVHSRVKLVPGAAPGKGPNKKSSKAKQRDKESAHHLQIIALTALAAEVDIELSHAQAEGLASDSGFAADLLLWSYAWEILRRSQFASQGAAVHQLWLALDKKKREKLNADEVWRSRERLLAELRRRAVKSD